ncbi:hypothetical protein F4678DRAFT_463984 [Xylaria arbuscula]|nr:hypothetical protein F4678DRAFT_463984 [Xylaria arbuscula]
MPYGRSRPVNIKTTRLQEADALQVHGVLSAALFNGVQARVPDTIGVLLAERSIREALSIFAGEHERRVSTFILTRTLDPRVNTPRTQMIHQSFAAGGPIALAGVFYATIDSHQNVQNRETLNLPVRIDERARLDLDKLDLDTKELARLFVCLGNSVVPMILFAVRACHHARGAMTVKK